MQLQALDQPGNLSTWAADINAAHADAVKHATSAIDYAKKAGELLLRVKQKLPHGAFGGWLEANCSVSERQAQRYMSAAQGKPVPVREIAKSDTVSDLPVVAPRPAKKPELTIVAPVVEAIAEEPEDYTELDAALDQISGLQTMLAIANLGDVPAEEKEYAKNIIEEQEKELKTLRATNRALILSRDSLMDDVLHMKRQMAAQRREIDRLKKAA